MEGKRLQQIIYTYVKQSPGQSVKALSKRNSDGTDVIINATSVGKVDVQVGDVSCGDVGGDVEVQTGDVKCHKVGGKISIMVGDVTVG